MWAYSFLWIAVCALSLPEAPVKKTILEKHLENFAPYKPDVGSSDWTAKGNIANAIGASIIPSVELPIPINVFLFGFDGTGKYGINISTDLIRQWLEHLDHSRLQTFIDTDQLKSHDLEPDPAEVQYRFDIHLIETSDKVQAALERTLNNNYRILSDEDILLRQVQVDGHEVSDLLDSLVTELKLPGYSMFVLHSSADRWLPFFFDYSYGYRSGFSDSELVQLQASPTFAELIQNTPSFSSMDFDPFQSGEANSSHFYSQTDFRAQSEVWATAVLARLPKRENPLSLDAFFAKLAARSPYLAHAALKPSAQEDCLLDAWLTNKRSLFLDISAGPFQWGPAMEGEGSKMQSTFPQLSRFASHRLANAIAEGFGAVGTQGIKLPPPLAEGYSEAAYDAASTLLREFIANHCPPALAHALGVNPAYITPPNIPLQPLTPENRAERAESAERAENFAENPNFPPSAVVTGHGGHHDPHAAPAPLAQHAADEVLPLLDPTPAAFNGIHGESSLSKNGVTGGTNKDMTINEPVFPAVANQNFNNLNREHILPRPAWLAGPEAINNFNDLNNPTKLHLLTPGRFASGKHSMVANPPLAALGNPNHELKNSPNNINNDFNSPHVNAPGPVGAGVPVERTTPLRRTAPQATCGRAHRALQELSKRVESKDFTHLNAFSFVNYATGERSPHSLTEPTDNEAPLTERDLETSDFLAHVSASLSRALARVVTPPLANSHLTQLYAPKINFHVYLLQNHAKYDPWLGGSLMEQLSFALTQLALPKQRFTFNSHTLAMHDDPYLAAAYAEALNTAVVPTLHADGMFQPLKRLFLDSHILAGLLKAANPKQLNAWGVPPPTAESREIPIFIFSLDLPLPVFVDVNLTAVAREGLVLAVQNAAHVFESGCVCNAKAQLLDLRDIVRPLATAAAQLLGGLLPPTLDWRPTEDRPVFDYTWATGDSPGSQTTAGLVYSATQRDAVHRGYGVTALRRASAGFNQAVRTLQAQRYSTVDDALLLALSLAHANARLGINAMADFVTAGQFADACDYISPLETVVGEFHALAASVATEAKVRTYTRLIVVFVLHKEWLTSYHCLITRQNNAYHLSFRGFIDS
jgi:hypothetical protein